MAVVSKIKPMKPHNGSSRLVEIDALRGLAAIAVVLFHYTTRFTEMYKPVLSPSLSVPYGFYGVNLFFVISGFVIFMTLERTTKPVDFVVSRFSRLFPAYWAAIFITFAITHVLGLPGLLVSFWAAVGNMLMMHGLLRIPNVDGVYWTLEVELLFYCGMFVLYRLRWLKWVHWALMALMALRMLYVLLAKYGGMELSWIVSHLLILQHIAWFSLGISVYLLVNKPLRDAGLWPLATICAAVITLGVTDSVVNGILGVVFAGAVYLAASGKIRFLHYRLFVWLGTISYPLYLLHENIGWSLQLRMHALGWSANMAVLGALVFSLTLAHLLASGVERPAMKWIRTQYKSRNRTAP